MNIHQEVDYLREENRQLKQMLSGPHAEFPKEWGLISHECRLLRALMAIKGVRPRETLLRACAVSESASENLLKVRVSRLRKKLTPVGIEIRTVYGIGYELSETAHTIVKKHVTSKPVFTFGVQSVSA